MGLVKILGYFCKHFRCLCRSKCSLNETEEKENGLYRRRRSSIIKETSL